jgi:hypothetical protein
MIGDGRSRRRYCDGIFAHVNRPYGKKYKIIRSVLVNLVSQGFNFLTKTYFQKIKF